MSSWIGLLSIQSTRSLGKRLCPEMPLLTRGLLTLSTRFENISFTAAGVNEFDWMLIVNLFA